MAIKSAVKKRAEKPKSVESLDTEKGTTPLINFKKTLQDLFVSPMVVWSTPSVRSAIDNHDIGQFNQSGRLVDAMMRDPRIFACCNTLIYGLMGLPFEWRWPDGYEPNRNDKKMLEIANHWFKCVLASATPATFMKWVANMGFSIIGKSWQYDYLSNTDEAKTLGKFYLPDIHVFHPSNVYYNTGTKTFWVITYNHGVIEIDPNDERFQIIRHVDSERPWMQGAVRSLGLVWLDKWMTMSDWRSYISLFGNPLRILTTDREYSTPPEKDIGQFIQDLAMALQYGAPVHLMKEETLDLLQANAANADLFKDKVDECNKEISIVYLGQNLTTDVSSGSYASAKVHDSVRNDYVEAYAATLNKALYILVRQFYLFNFPDGTIIPSPHFISELPVNELDLEKVNESKAKSLQDLSNALEKFKSTTIVVDGKEKSVLDLIDVSSLLTKFINPSA